MKNQGFITRNPQSKVSGNAFVIILIVIALLGALTVTVTRMGDNTAEVSQEEAQVVATKVLREAQNVANSVERLLSNGCSISHISFQNTTITNYTNVHSPADKSCWVFDSAGAGNAVPTPPSSANDGSGWVFAVNNNVNGLGYERETGVACSANCEDLLMILPVVNINVCKAINVLAQVRKSFNDAPPKDLASGSAVDLAVKFSAFTAAATATNFSNNTGTSGIHIRTTTTAPLSNGELWDKKTGCFETPTAGYKNAAGTTVPGTGTYMFYQLLYER